MSIWPNGYEEPRDLSGVWRQHLSLGIFSSLNSGLTLEFTQLCQSFEPFQAQYAPTQLLLIFVSGPKPVRAPGQPTDSFQFPCLCRSHLIVGFTKHRCSSCSGADNSHSSQRVFRHKQGLPPIQPLAVDPFHFIGLTSRSSEFGSLLNQLEYVAKGFHKTKGVDFNWRISNLVKWKPWICHIPRKSNIQP